MSPAVYESACDHPARTLVTPPGSFLSIIETIIARIPLPFEPDKPRLAAGEERKYPERRSEKLFQSAVIMCEFSPRSPSINYSRFVRNAIFLPRCSN